MYRVWALGVLGATLPGSVTGQTLAAGLARVTDGAVRFSFAAREGVCGGGHGISIIDHDDESEWDACARESVRVSLRLAGGRVAAASTRVGGRWRSAAGATDLGVVPAREAAAELLRLTRTATGDGEELITAASIADSATVWPELLRIARDPAIPLDTRRQAVFWVGQAASEAATRGLDSVVVDDRAELEIRKQAVFALSQRPEEESVPALIRIARANPHAELRKSALFWLGQTEDPRALQLFEEILR